MTKRLSILMFLILFFSGFVKSQETYFPEDLNLDSIVNIIVEFDDEPMFYNQTKSVSSYNYLFTEFYSDLDSLVQTDTLVRGMQYQTGREYYRLLTGVSLTVPLYLKYQIKALAYIKDVYDDFEVFATLDQSVGLINADDLWTGAYCSTGVGVVVAILDTGVDYNHISLGNGNWRSPLDKVIGGYDFVNSDNYPMDDNGHGTHVAGIVAANSDELKGVAPGASLLAYKVLDANGAGTTSDILAGIEAAIDPNGDGNYEDHADIVNMSLGSPYGSYDDILSTKVEQAIQDFDIVFCIAAGNVLKDCQGNIILPREYGTVSSPGTAPSAITVGACTKDVVSEIADFSLLGPSKYLNTIKPEIVAPGVDIVSSLSSTYNFPCGQPQNLFQINGYNYGPLSGTSMATPHIAGVCALIKQLNPEWNAYQIKSSVISTATLLYDDNDDLYDAMYQGSGRVDALLAATNKTFFDRLDSEGNIEGNDLSFGLISSLELQTNPAIKTIQLRVTNKNSLTQNYIIDFQEASYPAGVELTCSETTLNFSVLANSSKIIEFTLNVTNNVSATQRIFSGNVFISGDIDGNLHLPWAFVKNQIIWVDDDASGPDYSGTVSDPKLTIQSAINIASSYDYIIVKEGNYVSFTDARDYLTISSEYILNQSDENIIDNTIINTNLNPINPGFNNMVELNGFKIIGNNTKDGVLTPNHNGTVIFKNLKIENCKNGIKSFFTTTIIENIEVKNCGQPGQTTYAISCYNACNIKNVKIFDNNVTIGLYLYFSTVDLLNVQVYNNTTIYHKVQIASSYGGTIEKLTITDNGGSLTKQGLLIENCNTIKLLDIELENTGGMSIVANYIDIEDLYFHNNSPNINIIADNCIINNSLFADNYVNVYFKCTNLKFTNSTFTNTNWMATNAIQINNTIAECYNSIFYNNKQLTIDNSNLTVKYSDFADLFTNNNSIISIDETNISTNPLFSNAFVPYGLSSNSPCINNGDPSSDYQFEPMPHGCRVDMGAYGNTPFATNDIDAQIFTVIPHQNNFETGSLDEFIQTSGNVTVNTETGSGANNTNSWLQLGDGTNETKLFVNLKNTEYPVMSFYSKTTGISNPDDGIYFANDCGETPTGFIKVADLPNTTEWTKYLMNIRSLAIENDLTVNESFVIMFKYTGNSTFFAIDEINIENFAQPEIVINSNCNPIEVIITDYNLENIYNINYQYCSTGVTNTIVNAEATEYITLTEEGCYKIWLEIETNTGSISYIPIEKSIYFSEDCPNIYRFTADQTLRCENTIIGYYLSGSEDRTPYSLIKNRVSPPEKTVYGDGDPITFEDVDNEKGNYEVFANWEHEALQTKMDGLAIIDNIPYPSANYTTEGNTVCQGQDATVTVYNYDPAYTYTLEGIASSPQPDGENLVFTFSSYLLNVGRNDITVQVGNGDCVTEVIQKAVVLVNPLPETSFAVSSESPVSINSSTDVCLSSINSSYIYEVIVNSQILNLPFSNLCFKIPSGTLTGNDLNYISVLVTNPSTGCISELSDAASICAFDGVVFNQQTISGTVNLTAPSYLIPNDIEMAENSILNITGSTVYMYPQKQILLLEKSKLNITGSTIQNFTGCNITPNFWRGIVLDGDQSKPQTNTYQPELSMYNSTIKNTGLGISVGRVMDGGSNFNGGGILYVFNSNFINCNTGITFYPYKNLNSSGVEENNVSTIYQSHFETNENYLSDKPFAAIDLLRVKNVKIKGNDFINTAPNIFSSINRGIGINLNEASAVISLDHGRTNSFTNLYNGIKCSNSGTYTVNISGNTFLNNSFSINLSNISSGIITNNTIVSNSSNSGIRMDYCEGFKLEDNLIDGLSKGSGIYITNSKGNNEIYKNTIKNCKYGILANKNPNLYLNCNIFQNNFSHIYALNDGIYKIQGSLKLAAGNKFYEECTSGTSELYATSSFKTMFYYSFNSQLEVPLCHSSNYEIYNTETQNTCPTKSPDDSGGEAELLAVKQVISEQETELTALTDGGNTEATVEQIAEVEQGEEFKLMNELLLKSPFLSDTSLIVTASEDEVLPDLIIANVLKAKPQAAKSNAVQTALDNRTVPMPGYLRSQIDEGLTTLSEKEQMELEISENMFIKDQIISEIAIDILSDTIANRFSELEQIYIDENNINYDYQLIEDYIEQNRNSEALALFENISNNYILTPEQLVEYEQMSDLLNVQCNVPENNYFQLNQEQKQILYSLAEEGRTLASVISRNILFLVDTVEFPEPEFIEEITEPVTKSLEISEFAFTVSPNPANDYFIAQYDLADTEFKSSEFRMFSTDNKQVYKQTLTQSANQILIETETYEPGIYTCKLYKNNVEIGSQIIIIKADQISKDIDTEQLEEMLNTNDQLLVFPNPAKDFVVVSSKTIANATITIYDNTGKQVYSTVMDTSVKEISTANLASGTYVIQLKQNNVVLKTVKLMKE